MSQYNRAKSSNTLTLENLNNKIKRQKAKDISNQQKQDQINEKIFELVSLKEDLEKNKKEREEVENMINENNEKILKLYDTYDTKSLTCCNNVELNTSKIDEEKKIDDNNEALNDILFNLQYQRTQIINSLIRKKRN